MKSRKLVGTVIWLVMAGMVAAGPVSLLTGCASSKKKESTGQYVDDSVITGKVKEAILKEPGLKVNQIGVETYKGVVQLSGFVDSQDAARKAGDIAAGVPGVVSVKNNLIVK